MIKNLKKLFIVTEDAETTLSTSEKKDNPISENQKDKAKQPSTHPKDQPTGKADNAILDKLLMAFEDNNQSGFDYLEFKKALTALKDIKMDEATKYQSTFATASTLGVTVDKLLASIDFYKKVLSTEAETFRKAIDEQKSLKIETKKKEKINYDQKIKDKSLQIQKLTKEIKIHHDSIERLMKEIEDAENKIRSTSLNFDTSLKIISDQLDQDAENLRKYIK